MRMTSTVRHATTRCTFLDTLHPNGATASAPLAREDLGMAEHGMTT